MTSTPTVAPTTSFGIELLKSEAKLNKGTNVLVSPASVSIALAMAMNGARGKTQQGIATALALPDNDIATTNEAYANLLAQLRDNDALGVQLAVANAIWANQNVAFRPEFLQVNKDSYGAQVTTANFASRQTVADVNQWVSDNTNGLISKILDNISADEILFLINAVYFKGEWTVKFDKSQTTEQDFHTPSGMKKHPLMTRTGDMLFQEEANYQAIKLPFGEHKRINLYVFLPNEDVNVDAFVSGLDESAFTKLSKLQYETEGTLYLPRFELDYDVTINDSLQALGMSDAFGSGSDFSGMTEMATVSISKVKHKTIAKFDEEGGEAAAVTSIGFECLSISQPWEMRVDRPFVASLYDEGTGTLLFTGVVNDPK